MTGSGVGNCADRDPVSCLLEPRSIAVVGASTRPGSFGSRMAGEVLRGDGGATVYFVNPGYDEIAGRPCLASLEDVPGAVDLVLLGINDASLDAELTLAAGRGDRAAVVFGNAYERPADGVPALRDRLAATARGTSMALCGGGCMGFVNVVKGIRAIGYVEPDPIPAGPVALVTHSGSVFSAVLRSGRAGGFTVAVSSGQELVTTTSAYLDYALSLEQTGVIALVLETIRNAPALRSSLATAAARGIPVVLLPVGTSERGASMVAAHSGAVAGGRASWEALADAHGVHLVDDLPELLDAVELFAAGRAPRAVSETVGRRSGLAAVLDSGAERALLVDLADQANVDFAELSPATVDVLAGAVDPGLTPGNPLDVWGTGAETETLFRDALVTLAADEAVRVVALAVDLVEELDGDGSYPEAALRTASSTELPVVVLSHVPSGLDRRAALRLRVAGVPVLEGTRSGLRAVGHLLAHADRVMPAAPVVVDAARQAAWRARLRGGSWSATDGFAMLHDYGIGVAAARAADHEGAVLSAAAAIGYPVVLKTDRELAHKSEAGGVALDLGDETELVAAYRSMVEQLGPRVIVCRQVAPGVEVLLGAVRDAALGMVMVVGAGGVLTELVADRTAALPPVDAEHARALLARTKVSRLLLEPRFGPPADLDAVAAAMASFSQLVTELGDDLDAIEINPLVCSATGAVAVDVHVEVRR